MMWRKNIEVAHKIDWVYMGNDECWRRACLCIQFDRCRQYGNVSVHNEC